MSKRERIAAILVVLVLVGLLLIKWLSTIQTGVSEEEITKIEAVEAEIGNNAR